MGKNAHIAHPTLSMGVMRYLYHFKALLHNIIIPTTYLHIRMTPHLNFSMKKAGHVASKPQNRKSNSC